jgi:hypothetical protein
MQLLAPDVLEEGCALPVAIMTSAFALGFLLWLFGWRGHRFWIVLATTIAAGMVGLSSGPDWGTQRVVAGLLLAVAAGALALALVRVVAFVAGGLAVWMLAGVATPHWNEPVIFFLGGGLLGLLLFRVWTMVLTSLAGTLVMAYSGLCLAEHLGKVDIISLAEKQKFLLNCACGGTALAGLLLQYYLDRRRSRKKPKPAKPKAAPPPKEEPATWWQWGHEVLRRAG